MAKFCASKHRKPLKTKSDLFNPSASAVNKFTAQIYLVLNILSVLTFWWTLRCVLNRPMIKNCLLFDILTGSLECKLSVCSRKRKRFLCGCGRVERSDMVGKSKRISFLMSGRLAQRFPRAGCSSPSTNL